MLSSHFDDLAAFMVVAKERSFTKAAAKLGVSQPALSQMIKALEERIGFPLLTRTTRSVSPTEAGERLLNTVGPKFEEIDIELTSLRDLRDKPAGTIRITAGEHAAVSVLQPALATFLPNYPEVTVELVAEYGLVDIVAEGYDAGVRLGEKLELDMIAVRISPDIRMAVVGSPAYLAQHPAPRIPEDLARHRCINLRFPTHGSIFAWFFEKDGSKLKVRVDGPLAVNTLGLRISAVLSGMGLAYMPEDQAAPHVECGQMIRVLEDWSPTYSGYHLYYPSRRHVSSAFTLLVDHLRWRSAGADGKLAASSVSQADG